MRKRIVANEWIWHMRRQADAVVGADNRCIWLTNYIWQLGKSIKFMKCEKEK